MPDAVRPRRHGCCPASRGSRVSASARAWSTCQAARRVLTDARHAASSDGHALTVLAAAAIDGQESAAADHLPAIGRDGNVGDGVATVDEGGAGLAAGDRTGPLAALVL